LDLEKIVAELEQERDRLNQAIDLLKEHNVPPVRGRPAPGTAEVRSATRPRTHGGRHKRLSKLMKKRWAERRRKAKSS
jgi:hypothetical protein